MDRSAPNSIYVVGRAHLLQCCTRSQAIANKVIAEMADLVRAGRAVTLSVLESPVHAHGPLMWAPRFGRLTPIYEE